MPYASAVAGTAPEWKVMVLPVMLDDETPIIWTPAESTCEPDAPVVIVLLVTWIPVAGVPVPPQLVAVHEKTPLTAFLIVLCFTIVPFASARTPQRPPPNWSPGIIVPSMVLSWTVTAGPAVGSWRMKIDSAENPRMELPCTRVPIERPKTKPSPPDREAVWPRSVRAPQPL